MIYIKKVEKINNENDRKFKIEMMKMDIIGTMISGKNPGLCDKLNEGKEESDVESKLVNLGFEIKTK